MKNNLPALAGVFCLFAAAWLYAADYQGADSVLSKATQDSGAANALGTDSLEKLRRDLKAFAKKGATLKPEEAAGQWLDLAVRFGKLGDRGGSENADNIAGSDDGRPLSFSSILEALPPPGAWDEIAQQSEALPDGEGAQAFRTTLLRLTAHWLTKNSAAMDKDIATLDASLAKVGSPSNGFALSPFLEMKAALLDSSDDGDAIIKNLDDTLAARRGMRPSTNPDFMGLTLDVPDLVTLAGEKKAEAFLRRALVAAGTRINIRSGEETKSLARKLALELIDSLQTSQWDLAESLDATSLYEAMDKHFPATNGNSGVRDKARTFYLLGLIAAGRTDDATAVALQMGDKASEYLPQPALVALERQGKTRDLAAFFEKLLAQNPDLPFWDEYVQLAPKTGGADRMVALAEAAAARPGLNEASRLRIQNVLCHAYLAADKVDQGVAILGQEIDATMKDSAGDGSGGQRLDLEELGMQMARVGAALQREDLTKRGLEAVRYAVDVQMGAQNLAGRQSALERLAEYFIENDRGVDAESALEEGLSLPAPLGIRMAANSRYKTTLTLLMDVYRRANRPADVLALLDKAPQWQAKDLADVYTTSVFTDHNHDYAGYFAAWALAASGRKDEARAINDAVLDQEGGYDPSYELLLQLEPDKALARLDAVFARDQFEPRPLIWKAKLLLDQGKPEDAEAVARQAITIDPSDGQQGRGRRMRVYSVLADIRAARGDAKEAESLRGAVTAIRHSEDADKFYAAGLITRAVKMYEEALTHFADAYCIQSRLALRLAELGDMEGAEEHYRRAYELMPDSFGRVESHCFGCERAFAGERAQSIAEKVFTELAAKRPDKPQVHYLLGYLRTAEDRYEEALPEFREAVKLDPEYLNAWKQLAQVGEEMRLPAAERDAIELNILRLDPLGRHSSFDGQQVGDLRGAWTGMEAAASVRPPVPETLYPLAASAEALEDRQDAAGAQSVPMVFERNVYSGAAKLTLGQMVAGHRFAEQASALFQNSRIVFEGQ